MELSLGRVVGSKIRNGTEMPIDFKGWLEGDIFILTGTEENPYYVYKEGKLEALGFLKGNKGETGPQGEIGLTPNVEVGTVDVTAGEVSIVKEDIEGGAKFNFKIPTVQSNVIDRIISDEEEDTEAMMISSLSANQGKKLYDTMGAINLGSISDPYVVSHDVLNNITKNGIYTFTSVNTNARFYVLRVSAYQGRPSQSIYAFYNNEIKTFDRAQLWDSSLGRYEWKLIDGVSFTPNTNTVYYLHNFSIYITLKEGVSIAGGFDNVSLYLTASLATQDITNISQLLSLLPIGYYSAAGFVKPKNKDKYGAVLSISNSSNGLYINWIDFTDLSSGIKEEFISDSYYTISITDNKK